MKKKDIDFFDRDLLFVDLETSGFDMEKQEILEIGCLVVDGRTLEIKKKYHERVKPQHIKTASKEALKIAQYSERKWLNAKSLKIALNEVASLAPNAMVAGWKVDFDWYFLERGFNKYKIKHGFDYHLIDVISMAYLYFWKKKVNTRFSLGVICKMLNIPIHEKHHEGEGHGAMVDIEATYKVFKKLINEFNLS